MAELIGDAEFVAQFQTVEDAPVEIPAGVEQVPVTVDKHGEIVGDTSNIDPGILAQMSTPEAKAQIAEIWRKSKYGKKEDAALPAPRYLNEGYRRDFKNLRPSGVSSKEFRQKRRKAARKLTKQAIRFMENHQHGQSAD